MSIASNFFRLTLRFFDDVSTVLYFFDSDFKFFDDASEFSVTSLYVVCSLQCSCQFFFKSSCCRD